MEMGYLKNEAEHYYRLAASLSNESVFKEVLEFFLKRKG
jgi:hypothetical protein